MMNLSFEDRISVKNSEQETKRTVKKCYRNCYHDGNDRELFTRIEKNLGSTKRAEKLLILCDYDFPLANKIAQNAERLFHCNVSFLKRVYKCLGEDIEAAIEYLESYKRKQEQTNPSTTHCAAALKNLTAQRRMEKKREAEWRVENQKDSDYSTDDRLNYREMPTEKSSKEWIPMTFLEKFRNSRQAASDYLREFHGNFNAASDFLKRFDSGENAQKYLALVRDECEKGTNNCGKTCKWLVDEDTGLLLIQGKGAMHSYEHKKGTTTTPWKEFKDTITNVLISDGITEIGESAFDGNENLRNVSIPSSVKKIGRWSFYGCTNLSFVPIPPNLNEIGTRAFAKCSNLITIDIDERNNSFKVINESLLTKDGKTLIQYACGSEEEKYSIPNGVENIEESAFSGCFYLKSIRIPRTVASIGKFAFSDCTELTSITIPDSVQKINDRTFFGCTNLTSVTLPERLTAIGEGSFGNCTNLAKIVIPSSVISIGKCAFLGCNSLESINVPENIKEIEESTFYQCTKLSSVNIPESVTSIGAWAFFGCSKLNSISLSKDITRVGLRAFAECLMLKNFIVDEDNTEFQSIDGSLFSKDETVLIQYAIGQPNKTYTIPKKVEIIGDCAFSCCSNLTLVRMQSGVSTIEKFAFNKCTCLTSISLPETVETIEYSAFSDCTKLEKVKVPTKFLKDKARIFAKCPLIK